MASGAARRAIEIAEQAEAWDGKGVFVPANAEQALIRAENALPDLNNVWFRYRSVAQAFPAVQPGVIPTGSHVLCQLRAPLATTGGGLTVDADIRKTELDNCQVAKVIALGPLAFRHRDTNTEWPEGAWCHPGEFIRIPKYQGDRWAVQYQREDNGQTDFTVFIILKDLAIIGKYQSAEAALAARAYL